MHPNRPPAMMMPSGLGLPTQYYPPYPLLASAEPKTATAVAAAASEKENDVVARKSRKRSSAAISHRSAVVTPPQPSSSAVASSSLPLIDMSPPSAPPSQVAFDRLCALIRLQNLQLQEQKLQLQEKSTATLASILDTAAPAVPTKFLSSLSGIGDDVELNLEEWSAQSKKIWSANLQAHGAATVDLERLFLPQIYKFCHNKQPIQVLLHSSFGPFGELEGMAFFEFLKVLFPQTSFVVVDQIPIAAPSNIGYLGQKNQTARILGVEDHLKIMNGLLSIFKEVGTDAIILGLGDAGRHSATLPDILESGAVHPCIAYGSFTGMVSTWDANYSYAQLHTKLYVGELTVAQSRIALKALQLQGERQAYETRPTNVATIEKQQDAWNSVEPIINKLRALHQGDPTIRNLRLGCRTKNCNNQLADDDDSKTLCSTCLDERKAMKLEKMRQFDDAVLDDAMHWAPMRKMLRKFVKDKPLTVLQTIDFPPKIRDSKTKGYTLKSNGTYQSAIPYKGESRNIMVVDDPEMGTVLWKIVKYFHEYKELPPIPADTKS